jgi:hypothetical protein
VNASHSRIRLTHSVIVKAPGLLPMLYLTAELAGELGMPALLLISRTMNGINGIR